MNSSESFSDPSSLDYDECLQLFKKLFPQGPAGRDVRLELVPDGWARSPFAAIFHPSIDRVWQEAVAYHENFDTVFAAKRKRTPAPTREEIARAWTDHAIDEDAEITDLVGWCLWDIFSDNHTVTMGDGRAANLGTFRGSADFIADYVSAQSAKFSRDYMDYYMGCFRTHGRASVAPVYRLIFRRLKSEGCTWSYLFPRIYIFRPRKTSEDNSPSVPYSPSEAFEREAKQAAEDAENQSLAAECDEMDAKLRAEARTKPPPEIVAAYRDIFGDWPPGWPP